MQCGQNRCIIFLWNTCSSVRISSVSEWYTSFPVTQATDLWDILNAFLSFTAVSNPSPSSLDVIYWVSFQSIHFCSHSLTPSRPSSFFFFWFIIPAVAVASYLHSGCNWFWMLHAESFQNAKPKVLSSLVLVYGSPLLKRERCVLISLSQVSRAPRISLLISLGTVLPISLHLHLLFPSNNVLVLLHAAPLPSSL